MYVLKKKDYLLGSYWVDIDKFVVLEKWNYNMWVVYVIICWVKERKVLRVIIGKVLYL